MEHVSSRLLVQWILAVAEEFPEIARRRETAILLRSLEWSGLPSEAGEPCCPACDEPRSRGHLGRPDRDEPGAPRVSRCRLEELLGG